MESLKTKLVDLVSKKLSVVLVSILTVVLNQKLGLGIDDQTILTMAGVVITYLVGQVTLDHKKLGSK